MGKALVIIGLLIAAVGALVILGFPLGRLPGDLMYRRGNLVIYVPFATSIVLSIVLTFLVMLLRR